MHDFINKIICGDSVEVLNKIPDESINCVMFSPPYWSIRDYKVKKQIGLESSYNLLLVKMWQVMDEIYRVLRKDGTIWVNLGDVYASEEKSLKQSILPKSLLMLPEKFILGLIDPEFRNFIEQRNSQL